MPKGEDVEDPVSEKVVQEDGNARPDTHRRVWGYAGRIEFIDDHSRWSEVRFLRTKSEVFQATKEYIALIENQKGKTVKALQSDKGGEYTSYDFETYLKQKRINRRLTAPFNPEQNGTAERKNRTLLDAARCLLAEANLPKKFWAEAQQATYQKFERANTV